MSKLIYEKKIENGYIIKFNNNNLGELSMLEDGFYYWFPTNFIGLGCISSWVIKDIYTKLEELNRDYQEHINKYFKDENN